MTDSQSVALHPIGLDHRLWEVAELAIDMPLDLPGHGTARPPAEWTLKGVVDDVLARCGERIDLIGASVGGIVAQHVAIQNAERVRSLVLVCCGTRGGDPAELARRASETRQRGMSGTVEGTMERWFGGRQVRGRDEGVDYCWDTWLANDPETVAAYWEMIADHDAADQLARLRLPTTVVGGTSDWAAPPDVVQSLSAAIPRAQLEMMPGPHMMMLRDAGTFRSVIDNHFDRVARLERATP